MQTITLDLPPSLNSYYRHGGKLVLISADGRADRDHVERAVIEQQVMPYAGDVRLWMHVLVERSDLRRADLDNSLKALQDAMEERRHSKTKAVEWPGVYQNDGQIDLLVVERGAKQRRPQVTVSIGTLAGSIPKVLPFIRGATYIARDTVSANEDDLKAEQLVA